MRERGLPAGRQAGLTFIELLVALLLLAVALSGLMGLWTFGFNTTRHSQDLGVGYNVARQEIERAKNIGFLLLPEAEWTTTYDGLGHVTTETPPHFTAHAAVHTIPDASGQTNSSCLRTLYVRVNAREGNEVVFESTTYLSWGGI
jgi:prepilin-type N-terminal cleavage/methylation domain-containing protein